MVFYYERLAHHALCAHVPTAGLEPATSPERCESTLPTALCRRHSLLLRFYHMLLRFYYE